MDFLMTVTMPRLEVPSEADALLTGFQDAHPQANPVVAEDLTAQTVDVTFLVVGATADEALAAGRRATAAALDSAGAGHQVLSVQLEPVGGLA